MSFSFDINGVSITVSGGNVTVEGADTVTFEGQTVVEGGEVVTTEVEEVADSKVFFVKVRGGVPEFYATKADADAAKTSPRAEMRFEIDYSQAEEATDWQHVTL